MSSEISSRRPTGSNVSPRGPRRRSPKQVSSIFQSAKSNRPGKLRNRSLSVETWASVCVAADLADSPSQLPVASFRRGKPFLAGLPFDWALSLASWNKIYYVFCVHLISWSWRTWLLFQQIILTWKNVFPVLRNSVTAFLHLAHIFPMVKSLIPKQFKKSSRYKLSERVPFCPLTLLLQTTHFSSAKFDWINRKRKTRT